MDKAILKSKYSNLHTLEHLYLSEKLEETGTSALVTLTILLLTFLVIIMIVWSAFTTVDEVASVEGTVIPSSKVYMVQHVDGGSIFRVNKTDGEYVKRGEVILELGGDALLADLERLKNRVNVLDIDIVRLQSFVGDTEFNGEIARNNIVYKNSIEDESLDVLIKNSVLLYEHQVESLATEKRDILVQVQKQKSNLQDIETQLKHLGQRKKILQDQISMYDELLLTQSTSKLDHLRSLERVEDINTEILEVTREKTGIEARILELEGQLLSNRLKVFENALEQLNDFTAEVMENKKQITKIEAKIDGLKIEAPNNGYIKGLNVRAGSIIKPAELILEIVPVNLNMLVEAKVKSEDIGYIKINNSAKVKVSSYDFAMYGDINGTVINISPSTFLDQDNLPYYKATIHLEKNYVGDDSRRNPVLPGMEVIVDIKTGTKSLLQYFLKPINRTWAESFKEK